YLHGHEPPLRAVSRQCGSLWLRRERATQQQCGVVSVSPEFLSGIRSRAPTRTSRTGAPVGGAPGVAFRACPGGGVGTGGSRFGSAIGPPPGSTGRRSEGS